MKTQPTPNHGYHRTSLSSLTRIFAATSEFAIGGRKGRSRQFKRYIGELS